MAEPTEPRPELCEHCASEKQRRHCTSYPTTCVDRRELWDSGYAAGKAASREECTLLAASLKQADKRAEAAADAYREADARCERLELDYTAEMSAREAEAKLAELEAERESWKRAADSVAAKYAEQAQADMKRAEAAEERVNELVEALEAHDVHVGMSEKDRVEAIRTGRAAALIAQRDAAIKRAEAAEATLAELVRDVREWRAERFGPAILDAILAKYDKPEGG